jgi:hypothetical protein
MCNHVPKFLSYLLLINMFRCSKQRLIVQLCVVVFILEFYLSNVQFQSGVTPDILMGRCDPAGFLSPSMQISIHYLD